MISIVCSILLMFLTCPADHRYLHSFPTRRSSDLIVHAIGHYHAHLVTARTRQCEARGVDQPLLERLLVCGVADRKSTRLNSSHRCISYAVFCLKKKNRREMFREHAPVFACTYTCH